MDRSKAEEELQVGEVKESSTKRKELEELAPILDSLRKEEKKIVLCHGVFDLLHIGHIRHFQEAKQLGDVLVVTLTPDQHVNKGPHRPTFTQELRAEAIAALDCVDYVAINRWPMAAQTIKLLRPDFYVKGADYKQSDEDYTGGIGLEESAIKAIGGQLVFTNDVGFSSTSLINRYLSVFPKEVTDYLKGFGSRHSAGEVLGHLEDIASLKVLVIGESIIDEYQYCEAIGKSFKEPMLALRRFSTERFAGGILAVGNNVANFCREVGLISFLGDEHPQEDFVREKLNLKMEAKFLYRKNSPTIVKRRFVESYFFTKLLEVYEINDGTLEPEDNEALCATLESEIPKYDVVIVVDFGHGMLGEEAIQLICSHSRFLALNVQSNAGNLGYHTIQRYTRADYLCMTESEIRIEARDRRGDLKKMILEVSERLGCDRLTVTRGKLGCLCYSKEEGFFEVPAFAGQVVDRMGAGDAFLSITAPCVARRIPTEVVGFIGNVVGAQAVATVGHRRPIDRVPLFKYIESLLK